MIPIEALVIILWVAFIFAGIAREFPRELGATIGFVTMMLVLDLGSERLGSLTARLLQLGGLEADGILLRWTLNTAVIVLALLFMYQGEGLVYGGSSPAGLPGAVLNATVGALNWWLVVGTWWYYTHLLDYPIQKLGLYTPPLSTLAQQLVAIAPMSLLPDERSWLYLTTFLIFLLVLKVAR